MMRLPEMPFCIEVGYHGRLLLNIDGVFIIV
jgi:hypothetical protein